MKKRLLLTTIAICLQSQVSLANSIENKILEELGKYDHIAIDPPSDLVEPGSFVYRKQYDSAEVFPQRSNIGFLCTPEYSTQRIAATPSEQKLSGFFAPSVKADQDFLEQAGFQALLAASGDMTLYLRNRAILSFGKDQLRDIYQTLGPKCRENIQKNRKTDNAFQIVSVYRMKMEFKASFNARLKDHYRDAIMAELDDKFGGDDYQISRNGNRVKISGEAHIYGINWEPVH